MQVGRPRQHRQLSTVDYSQADFARVENMQRANDAYERERETPRTRKRSRPKRDISPAVAHAGKGMGERVLGEGRLSSRIAGLVIVCLRLVAVSQAVGYDHPGTSGRG